MRKKIDAEQQNKLLKEELRRTRQDLYYHKKRNKFLRLVIQKLRTAAITADYSLLLEITETALWRLDAGISKEDLVNLILGPVRDIIGTKTKTGDLPVRINLAFHGIIDRLEKDLPDCGPYDINLFCACVIDINNLMIAEVFGLDSKEKAAKEKYRLLSRIRKIGSEDKNEYMELLEKKNCSYGKNLLPLRDMIKQRNGKA
ncbi:MAG: hypothetical protein J5835_07200 [Bacteroidales bacterium]|nr:hypothetical protein [Bacteroidales bacterium]